MAIVADVVADGCMPTAIVSVAIFWWHLTLDIEVACFSGLPY
jgi:hypothetical protein